MAAPASPIEKMPNEPNAVTVDPPAMDGEALSAAPQTSAIGTGGRRSGAVARASGRPGRGRPALGLRGGGAGEKSMDSRRGDLLARPANPGTGEAELLGAARRSADLGAGAGAACAHAAHAAGQGGRRHHRIAVPMGVSSGYTRTATRTDGRPSLRPFRRCARENGSFTALGAPSRGTLPMFRA